MAVESRIRELLSKANEVDTTQALVEETQDLEEKAGLPNSKDVGDKTAPAQGSSNPNPEQEDLSGADDKGGLTSPVGKAASAKASKDNTLPKGQGAGDAPNFDSKEDTASVVNQASSAGVREEAEQMDEISKDMASSYKAAAQKDRKNTEARLKRSEDNLADTGSKNPKRMAGDDQYQKDSARSDKRAAGIAAANKKLNTKEEVEMESTDYEEYEEEALFEADITSLFADEEHLSEEFKTKAANIFEAVVVARVASEMEAVEVELREEYAQEQEQFQNTMVEKIDSYLSYVAENWMKENELAIEKGLRTEITESFIGGLQNLFADHYIQVPEEKYDVLGEMQTQIDELKSKLDESIAEKMEIVSEKTELLRNKVLSEASTDLTVTEAEKLAKLVENVDFDDENLFSEKVAVIKENYFPKVKASEEDKMQDTVDEAFISESSPINIYAQAISKAVKK